MCHSANKKVAVTTVHFRAFLLLFTYKYWNSAMNEQQK